MEKVITWALLGILATLLACLVACLYAVPVMLLWNAVIPAVFGLKEITFWQALMLSLLSSLLFKSPHSSNSNSK